MKESDASVFANREAFETVAVGFIDTITDAWGKKWSVVQHRYPKNIELVGKQLGNICIYDVTTKTAGKRYRDAVNNAKSPLERPGLEIYSIRPQKDATSGELEDTDAVVVFSYSPRTRSIIDVECKKTTDEKRFLQRSDAHADAFWRFVKKARNNELDVSMPIESVFTMGNWFKNAPRQATPPALLHTSGAVHDFHQVFTDKKLDPAEYIAGGIVRITPAMTYRAQDIARIAQEYPVTLDMTWASDEQKQEITTVRGSLIDLTHGNVSYPKLRTVGCNAVFGHGTFMLPELTSVEHIVTVFDTDSFVAPKLDRFFAAGVQRDSDIAFSDRINTEIRNHTKWAKLHVEFFGTREPFDPSAANF